MKCCSDDCFRTKRAMGPISTLVSEVPKYLPYREFIRSLRGFRSLYFLNCYTYCNITAEKARIMEPEETSLVGNGSVNRFPRQPSHVTAATVSTQQ
jgi:hypothetical protein